MADEPDGRAHTSHGTRRSSAMLIGLAPLVGAADIYLRAGSAVDAAGTNLSFARVDALVFLLAAAAVCIVASRLSQHGRRFTARPIVLCGAGLFVVSCFFIVLCATEDAFNVGRAATSGLLGGIGMMLLMLLWGRAFVTLPPRTTLLASCISWALGVIVSQLVCAFIAYPWTFLIAALLALVSLGALHVEYGRNDDFIDVATPSWADEDELGDRLGRMRGSMAKPLLLCIAGALVIGVLWDPAGSAAGGWDIPHLVESIACMATGFGCLASSSEASRAYGLPSDIPFATACSLTAVASAAGIVIGILISL